MSSDPEIKRTAKQAIGTGLLSMAGSDLFWKTLSQFGAVGVVCLLLWWFATKTLPEMQSNFSNVVQNLQNGFHEELKEERAIYRETLKESYVNFKERADNVSKAVERQAEAQEKTSKAIDRLVSELRKDREGVPPEILQVPPKKIEKKGNL